MHNHVSCRTSHTHGPEKAVATRVGQMGRLTAGPRAQHADGGQAPHMRNGKMVLLANRHSNKFQPGPRGRSRLPPWAHLPPSILQARQAIQPQRVADAAPAPQRLAPASVSSPLQGRHAPPKVHVDGGGRWSANGGGCATSGDPRATATRHSRLWPTNWHPSPPPHQTERPLVSQALLRLDQHGGPSTRRSTLRFGRRWRPRALHAVRNTRPPPNAASSAELPCRPLAVRAPRQSHANRSNARSASTASRPASPPPAPAASPPP